ncbi:unnamed protein product, partial [Menidia menidia]
MDGVHEFDTKIARTESTEQVTRNKEHQLDRKKGSVKTYALHRKEKYSKKKDEEGDENRGIVQICREEETCPICPSSCPIMAGCTSRCRQGVLKLIQSLQRLVSGTLTK